MDRLSNDKGTVLKLCREIITHILEPSSSSFLFAIQFEFLVTLPWLSIIYVNTFLTVKKVNWTD